MRRYWRERQPTSMFRGAELLRLLTGIVMLAVLYMLIVRAGDPYTWRWLAGDSGKQTAKQDQLPTLPLPEATGPTDEDPDQAETARYDFQALTDGTLELGREEMSSYYRLVEWTKNQSFARLYRRAEKDLWYSHLYGAADRHRGELVGLNLQVIRADQIPVKNDYGVDLREVWGITEESRGRFYVMMVVDYPKEMPSGAAIREKARFAGYFLKLQGYEPGTAKPGQPREKAPLLIGRLEWEPAAPLTPDTTQELVWGSVVLGAVAATWLAWLVYCRLRGKNSRRGATPMRTFGGSSEEAIPLDVWLERSNFDDNEDGNSPEKEDDRIGGDGDLLARGGNRT